MMLKKEEWDRKLVLEFFEQSGAMDYIERVQSLQNEELAARASHIIVKYMEGY